MPTSALKQKSKMALTIQGGTKTVGVLYHSGYKSFEAVSLVNNQNKRGFGFFINKTNY